MTNPSQPLTASDIQDAWPLFVAVAMLVGAFICAIPASIAKRKGRSFWGFFLVSAFVPFGWVVMLIIAISLAAPDRADALLVRS